MIFLRTFLARHRWLAFWLVAAALMVKVVIPAGFMPGLSNGVMTVQLCTSQGARTVTMPLLGTDRHHDAQDRHQKNEMPCVFAGLAAPALSAADPILLAGAVTFIMTAGFHAATYRVAPAPAHLRPPLRGPPATA